ncbi:anthranilate synthase component I [Rossellomorea aquimaris]|uniref:anthranilate synthase component I n=1 Tax=Rossellomorea aquimaris TaxID=189382 RepID=UPI001CD75F4C|nr:anthranilate synthase component I [Rossellomorea aquimaris]MCA1058509.1 anthranilate synthase component I [Rossellomorea aquimaris]
MMKQQELNYVVKELNGDMFTPISLYQSLKGKKKFLLESSLKHEQSGRYSFVGSDPFLECKAYGNTVQFKKINSDEIEERTGDPIAMIQNLIPRQDILDAPFPFTGGGIGYLGYDVIRQYEEIGITPHDELEMPDIHLMFYEKVIVFDHLEHKVFIVVMDEWIEGGGENLQEKVEEIEDELTDVYLHTHKEKLKRLSFTAQTSKGEFMEKVHRAKEAIKKGEIFQVVLSQRLQAPFSGDPFSFYRSLRKSNPSPYMFFIDFEDYIVLGASPESLLKVQGKEITTNPIAGTRHRGNTVVEDLELEKELLSDEKEIAEHRMLVDLGRNDLGRICTIGSIFLSKYLTIERYKYVMHIVSEVKGELKEDVSPLEALTSCLPAGTVSGAPKIRAMQIINQLETTKRGVYSGAVGYIGVNGNLDFALAIRTMVLKDGKANVQAGAGIVYDSDPESEYEETLNKAKSLLEVTG